MKLFLICAAALFAPFVSEVRAEDASPASPSYTQASQAPEPTAAESPAPASSFRAVTAKTIRVSHHVRRHGSSRGGLFRQWCAYNCYAVPPCSGPSCYGRYGYSHFAYDEVLPFPHRWDRDASPIDNVDAYIYRYTGEPFIRAFERIY
jgi:hypothetical protein